LYDITSADLKAGRLDEPTLPVDPEAPPVTLADQFDIGSGRRVFVSRQPSPRVAIYDPQHPSSRLQWVQLQVPSLPLSTVPVPISGGFLVASSPGPVYLVDASSGQPLLHPFQPRLEPGSTIQWHRPAVVDYDQRQFVLADDRSKVYRVGVKESPKPHLVAVAQATLEGQVASPLAALGDAVYCVVRGAEGRNALTSLNASDLAKGTVWEMKGGVGWGPARVGEVVMVASDLGELMCIQADRKRRWTARLEGAVPAGPPLALDGQYVVSTVDGTVRQLAADTGKEIGRFEVGQPLGSGPVDYGQRLLVAGHDGTLFVLTRKR
jgi:hypothetical protein